MVLLSSQWWSLSQNLKSGCLPNTTTATRPRRKAIYHIRNWSAYDRAWVQRGLLTVWISEEALATRGHHGPWQRGAQFDYSDQAIEALLTVKEVFHLSNRAAEGLVRSVFALLHVALSVPDPSTVSRRGRIVRIQLPRRARGPLHVVMDSSGLKGSGEGEWKVRQHGWSKRRTWRKMHLSVDVESGEVQAAMLSTAGVSDAEMVEPMLAQIEEPRDEAIRFIRVHGRRQWKVESDYHQRSLAETAIFRFKTIIGDHLSPRLLATQATPFGARCRALNIMTHLGMPGSYKVD